MPFYRDVFGWDTHTMSDTDEFRYTTLGEGDDAKAGIMDATTFLGDQPSRWQFYVEVARHRRQRPARHRRRRHASSSSAENTPYGRLAVIADPAGIPFAIMGPDDRLTGLTRLSLPSRAAPAPPRPAAVRPR